MNDSKKPSRLSLILRPFGYLSMSIIWLAIAAIGVFLAAYYGAGVTEGYTAPLGEMPGFDGITFFEMVGAVLIVLPVMATIVGLIFSFIVMGSLPLSVLSMLFFFRSLMPKYASEKLSYTIGSKNTYRPPTISEDVALSLMPVKETKFTDQVVGVYMAAWNINGKVFLGSFIIGVAFHAFLLLLNTPISQEPLGIVLWVAIAMVTLWGLVQFWKGAVIYREQWQNKLG